MIDILGDRNGVVTQQGVTQGHEKKWNSQLRSHGFRMMATGGTQQAIGIRVGVHLSGGNNAVIGNNAVVGSSKAIGNKQITMIHGIRDTVTTAQPEVVKILDMSGAPNAKVHIPVIIVGDRLVGDGRL